MSKQKQKEPLPIMIVKTVLAIAVLTGLGTIIFGGGVVIMKYYNSEVNNEMVKPVNQEKENYYDVLEKRCAGDSCCLSSLKIMKENNYKEADKDYKCPDVFKLSGLRCESSEFVNPDNLKGKTNYPDVCCPGLLKKLRAYKINDNGECEGIVGTPFLTCMPCGNRVCQTINNFEENKCNCPEDCGEEKNILDERKFYCEEDNDCLATCTSPGCYNKNWYETVMRGDCEAVIIHSCECVNNKCQRTEEQSDTSDWQTYRSEEFGFEFKYPVLGINNEEVFIKEKNNWIEVCVKIHGDYDFCHSLRYYKKLKEETVEDSIKRQILDEDEQIVCTIEKKGSGLENKFKAYYYIDCPSVEGPPNFAYNNYISDSNYPELFLMYSVGHAPAFDVSKWINSIKFIES